METEKRKEISIKKHIGLFTARKAFGIVKEIGLYDLIFPENRESVKDKTLADVLVESIPGIIDKLIEKEKLNDFLQLLTAEKNYNFESEEAEIEGYDFEWIGKVVFDFLEKCSRIFP